MSNDTERPTTAALWLDGMLRAAYPETAGITLAAIEAMAGQETFSRAQVAYLAAVCMDVGAQVRSAADRAELDASREASFAPRPTREARIALRTAAMAEQHEIAWLRRTGAPPPEVWPGGSGEDAERRYGWDADRPDHVPAEISVRVREIGRGRFAWKDEA